MDILEPGRPMESQLFMTDAMDRHQQGSPRKMANIALDNRYCFEQLTAALLSIDELTVILATKEHSAQKRS